MQLFKALGWTLAVVWLSACGRDSRPARTGDCPDISGNWRITDHCETTSVGTSVAVTQTGCSFTSSWGGTAPGSGTVDATGRVNMTVDIGEGTTLTCGGSTTSGNFTVDCTPGGCHVVLARPAGTGSDAGPGGGA